MYPPLFPSRRRGWPIAAGAAAAVVVVCLLGLALLGVLPGFGPSAGPAGPVPYSAARTAALDSASSQFGGQWAVLYAGAFNGHAATSTAGFGTPVGLGGCSVAGLGSYATSNLTLPALDSGFGSGSSPAWLFLLRNSSNIGLIVAVLDGSASPVASIQGPTCTTGIGLIGVVPSSAIDSPTALATAGRAGGTAFLSAHPDANVTFVLSGGVSLFGFGTGSTWSVLYSGCGGSALPGSSAAAFNATINASLGTLVATSSANVTCTGAPSIPLATAGSHRSTADPVVLPGGREA